MADDRAREWPDLSTLPKRMRYAAEVLDEARSEYHSRPENRESNWLAIAWNKGDLCTFASRWEQEDAARDAVIDALARALMAARGASWDAAAAPARANIRLDAEYLYRMGWRNPDERDCGGE